MTQPTRMPRTTLKFNSGVDTPLVPERGERYYSTPNPMRDNSGAFEAIKAAGPRPYARDLPGRMIIFLVVGLFGAVFAAIGLMLILSKLRHGDATADSLRLTDTVFFIVGMVFVVVAVYSISSALARRRRIVTAWKNGWIDYYPALVGQVYHCRTERRESESSGSTFYYYYRAPLHVLYPDGSFRQMHSFEFEMKRKPDWYSTRFSMASSAETAVVDGLNNNGWAIVGISRRPGQTHAELDSGLTKKQCEAVFNLAERDWLRTAW
ncbi:hypothetical protein L8U58_02880 [Corynebacterium sp. c9Ua_112]|uniref:Uncharacterized protein n=1 Tax=Corynebacterium macclintockiae TaxID=2913501 RepID=A0A9X3M5C1_9CORY|nr:hypothetical protein [Corynebacterium macclintockiae]MCZ9304484.1 hypothetical protein [Corynebacterium macclintockiae]